MVRRLDFTIEDLQTLGHFQGSGVGASVEFKVFLSFYTGQIQPLSSIQHLLNHNNRLNIIKLIYVLYLVLYLLHILYVKRGESLALFGISVTACGISTEVCFFLVIH